MEKQILIIEDCEMMQRFLNNFLRKEYEVKIAGDKKTAAEMLQTGTTIPELILMDINLPDGNGLDFITDLKNNTQFQHIQILALSGEKNQDIRWKSLENGADDFVNKPFLPRELKVRLKKMIQTKMVLKAAIEREITPIFSNIRLAV